MASDAVTNNKSGLTGIIIDTDMLKSTFTVEYGTDQTNVNILTPSSGYKLCIRRIEIITNDTAAVISLDFNTSNKIAFKKYASNDLKIVSQPSHLIGTINEPLTLNLAVTGGKKAFLLINYVEHK